MHDEPPIPLPPPVIASAYLLALLGLGVPLAIVGAVFAAAVLVRRGHRGHGLGVIAASVACTALGLTLLR